MSFKVTSVIDGDTFDVSPSWKWDNGKTGSRVRIANYDAKETGERGGKTATRKLTNLIYGKHVELKNAVNISYGRIVCDVYLNGVNIVQQLS